MSKGESTPDLRTNLVQDDGAVEVATTERDITEREQRERELDAMERLHRVSALFLRDQGPEALLEEILDAAIAISEADFGNIQMLDPESFDLRLVAQRGLPPSWLEFWSRVSPEQGACGTALQKRDRVIVEDVSKSPIFAGRALEVHREAEVRAVQSTPLISRSGAPLGMISTHYRTVHRPPERTLQLLDLLARQAADVIERVQTEAALRRAEALSSGILSTSADAIISLDAQHRITLFNRAAEEMFGYSQAEALGAPLDLLIPERFHALHRQRLARFAEADPTATTPRERRTPFTGRRKNGDEFPGDAAISKVTIGVDTILTIALRDVTDQHRIAREQRVLAELGAALASLEYDETLKNVARIAARALADLVVLFVMEEGGELRRTAAATKDPAQAWCADLIVELPPPFPTHPLWQALGRRSPSFWRLEPEHYQSIAQSPEHLRMLHTLRPRSQLVVPLLLAGQCVGALVLISSSREFEEGDLRLAEELGRRCALYIENARLHRAEQRAIQARDEVLGVVAHDLRNPLSTIVIQSALLRRRGPEPDRRSPKPVDAIERAAKRMNRIIQDLLDVTRLEAGHLTIERAHIPAREMVAEVIEAHDEQVTSRALELRLEVPEDLPEVWADRHRLQQVFENLVGNAVKFTTRGTISVGAEPRHGEVLFWVADTGPGIAAEDVPHLFDRFWQARRSDGTGAGLGLSIVRGIIEAHGGRIWVESQLGAGATFFFTLPIAAEQPHSQSS